MKVFFHYIFNLKSIEIWSPIKFLVKLSVSGDKNKALITHKKNVGNSRLKINYYVNYIIRYGNGYRCSIDQIKWKIKKYIFEHSVIHLTVPDFADFISQ